MGEHATAVSTAVSSEGCHLGCLFSHAVKVREPQKKVEYTWFRANSSGSNLRPRPLLAPFRLPPRQQIPPPPTN